jgi:Uma2 family endonuclease
MTADELLRLPEKDCRYELVRGELRTRPFSGMRRSLIAMNIIGGLGEYAERGQLLAAPCGFWIERDPDTVRITDLAFIRRERVVSTDHFFPGPPDVAFEIRDWGNTAVEEKAAVWLQAGTEAVVIVDAEAQTASVVRLGGTGPLTDALAIEDVIPGWRMPLTEVFR